MNDKMIMEFKITIDGSQVSVLHKEGKTVTFIPFGGSVESELFTGTIRPGAADIQVTNPAGIRHMLAQYMFEGKDFNGTPCHLFVRNDGFFERNSMPMPFEACPTFITDSPALAEYLESAHFRSEGWGSETGVSIRIFDTNKPAD